MEKKLIRLTENDLHRIVKESVKRALNELSTDTIESAKDKAVKKYNAARQKYGDNDPRTKRAAEQYGTFDDSIRNTMLKGNVARKSRILQNREDRKNGKRTYQKGIGWRTKM